MATQTVFKVVRGLVGAETGRWCRSCGETIARRDGFGMSEGVCRPCRGDDAASLAHRSAV
jgi:hypothetical protein